MRRTRFIIAGLGIATTTTLLLSSGCTAISHFESDCEKGNGCDSFRPTVVQTKPTCTGTPTDIDSATQKPKFLNDGCAVFAWAGTSSAKGTGTMEDPYRSLRDAASEAKGRWVIACSKDDFKEEVITTFSIYGGFDCTDLTNWTKKDGQKTNLLGVTAGKPTLTLKNAGQAFQVHIEDLAITAPTASLSGVSSIGVIVDNMDAKLARCIVTAHDAGDGAAGTKTPNGVGVNGGAAVMQVQAACGSAVVGGPSGEVNCNDGTADPISKGGQGGAGGDKNIDMGKGQDGASGDGADATYGKGGIGGTVAAPVCFPGVQGKPGTQGDTGPGGAVPVTLTLEGISGGDGGQGKIGKRGQGGGGGGGASSDKLCPFGAGTTIGFGASGGGGGSGGCGGKGGGGGYAGGSSIAILSLGAKLALDTVVVISGRAGNGGPGGSGEAGGKGGEPGPGGTGPSASACAGGRGGQGGIGGEGGGGRGGSSLGIAWKVKPAVVPTFDSMSQHGEAGKGGDPPSGMSKTGSGTPGAAELCWDFAANKSCSP